MTLRGPGHSAEGNRSIEGDQAPAVSHRERQQVGVRELTAGQVVVHVCRIEERDERVLITASSS